jgi:hypothetical protein
MNNMTPETSASTSTPKTKIAVRRSGRFDTGSGAKSSSAKAEPRSLLSETHSLTPDVFQAKRASLLEEKQVWLEQVVDRHDDLVRFHSAEVVPTCVQEFCTTEAGFAGTGVVPHAAVYDDDPV